MALLSPERLLSVWEQGARRHPIDRALLLFALAAPERAVDQLADLPLGMRNAALMALRQASFGRRLSAWVDCPACGERMEFALDAADLPPPPGEASTPVEVAGIRFEPPTSRHLAQLVAVGDPETAARQLLYACAAPDACLPTDPPALEALLDAVEAALDAADPWADLALDLQCPACGEATEARFDIAAYLWDDIDAHARALLDEVHTLARAYGWTEPEILALSDARRAAYLERVAP